MVTSLNDITVCPFLPSLHMSLLVNNRDPNRYLLAFDYPTDRGGFSDEEFLCNDVLSFVSSMTSVCKFTSLTTIGK